MQIFVMRHGQATLMGRSDSQRPLTETGRLEVERMAKWLNNSSFTFSHILVSPFVRAQQTADILVEKLNCSASLSTLDLITPSGSAREVHDYIDGACSSEKYKNILIVSHLPLVSYLTAELTVECFAPIFQTGAIAQIDYNVKHMNGHVVQLVSPNEL